MPMPKIPTLSRFCCFDVSNGTKYCSAALTILWILYLIAVIVAAVGSLSLGSLIWGLIWCGFSIVVYGLATYAIHLSKSRNLLIPALCVSLFNVCVGIINGIINFVVLNIFGAIVLFCIAAITLYYFLGLYTVYNNMSAPPAGEPNIKLPA
ncbi:uncharacterized protein LOC111710804 [Eurytemora carolleeae]|uniref:uncharacterized protein LOC111710804 n=1 Tax=Eurytemora carolleeae TaxID=1294199 RepID=UPI000C75F2B7|nr:uncharacterized protein LOC111710804 [Eurytemora carolleeae]|eukprot:XP_023340715.1 uncharacterized protein LOC111710804 [Eurytemora affinis]